MDMVIALYAGMENKGPKMIETWIYVCLHHDMIRGSGIIEFPGSEYISYICSALLGAEGRKLSLSLMIVWAIDFG